MEAGGGEVGKTKDSCFSRTEGVSHFLIVEAQGKRTCDVESTFPAASTPPTLPSLCSLATDLLSASVSSLEKSIFASTSKSALLYRKLLSLS